MKMTRKISLLLAMMLVLGCFAGCGQEAGLAGEVVEIEEEAVILAEAPAAVPDTFDVEASGELVKENNKAIIDYSNTEDGYVMVRYLQKTNKKLKAQVKGPSTTYTYNIDAKEWEVFPLSDENGRYQITVLENVSGSKYAVVLSVSVDVELEDEFAPFLRPNQYVDYSDAPKTVARAEKLTKGVKDPIKKVEKVYNYVIKNFTYDKEKAKTVKSGYLPDLDKVYKEKKGICFDYASLMTAMLRSQDVPCKLVVGYAGEVYHAWINVYVEGEGWVDGIIFFNGSSWERMDPTFASSAKQSKSIMKYIGDGENYTAKYFY